eukprot:scaffold183146_cov37-Tisochrysis_lutea.AAC.1
MQLQATKDQKRMGQQLARQQQEAKDAAAAAATAAADERTRLAQEACCAREAQAKVWLRVCLFLTLCVYVKGALRA